MRKHKLHTLLLLTVGLLFLGLFLLSPKPVLAANPTTINFQGKVVNANGTNVTDGTYSFVFRIYNTSSPTMTTSCTSTASCLWQETQASVQVTSGVFQVELGSACALTSGSCNNSTGGPIPSNWSNSSLYLTLQFNGDTSGSNGGYMSPLIHLTSVPFAFNSDNLGGLSASNFVQLAQGLQTDSSSSNASIAINKTGGTANILTLQKAGKNALVVDNSGTTFLGQTGASGLDGTLTFNNSAGSNTVSLSLQANPGSSFTLLLPTTGPSTSQCLQTDSTTANQLKFASCSGAGGSLASSYNSSGTTGNTIALSNSGQGVILQDAASSTITNLFAVQNNGGTSTYLAVTAANSGSVIVGNAANKITISSGSITTASGNLSIYAAGTTTIGNGTGAITINAGASAAVTITGHANSTWSTDTAASLTIQGGSTLSLLSTTSSAITVDSGTTGGVNIGTGANAKAIALGSTTSGTTIDAEGTTINIGNSTLTKTINIGGVGSAATETIGIGTNAGGVETITIGSTNSTSKLTLQGGSNDIILTTSTGNNVIIGSATTDTTQVLLQLDSFSTFADTATCTTSTNQGGMYYNTSTNAIRACVNGAWEDLASTAGLGIILFGVVPDSGSNPGDYLAQASPAHTTGPCKVSWKQNAGASQSAQVSVAPCVAFSGGRKVIVASTTTVTLDGTVASQWEHLCFTSSGTLPTTLSAGTSSEVNTANDPNASYLSTHQGAPYLCLADILMNSGTGSSATVANIYDVRTFTTTTKEFATAAAAMGLGVPAVQSGANVTNTTSTVAGGQEGVVVATDMAAVSGGAPNVILASAGPTFAKSTAGTAGAIVIPAAVASRLLTTAITTTAINYYEKYGVARTTFPATTCTATPNATNCDAAMYFFQSRN